MAKAKSSNSKSHPKKHRKCLVIGLGNMGSAMVRGLSRSSFGETLSIDIYDIHPSRCDDLADLRHVKVLGKIDSKTALDYDVIILCTKPQDLRVLSPILSGRIRKDALFISILAAVTTNDIANALRFNGAIVRAMPNIPATVGEAATAMAGNDHCDDVHRDLGYEIFASIGTASWTKESLMDAVTGLSGSGPAYVYMVIEALTDGGVKMGLPRPLALELATQTVVGSACLVQATGLHPAILRDQVTTPGGTTISAIHELEERGLRAMLMSAVSTATERSKVLREMSQKS